MKLENIKLYQRGDCIIVWFDTVHHTYWEYTQKEAIHLFKKKYGIHGKVERTKFCPFIIN